MKVIGIDPGLASTGIGIIEGTYQRISSYSFCTITTPNTLSTPQRLQTIYESLTTIFITEHPSLLILEDIFSLPTYPKSGIMLGKVCGIVLLACSQIDVSVFEIPVCEAKMILTGNGRSNKQQLEQAVRHTLNRQEPIKPSHASDALALALIGLFREYSS